MAATAAVLWTILLHYIFRVTIFKESVCAWRYSLGRCPGFSKRLYRHVADDQEKSGKLVLVDNYQYLRNAVVFC